MASERAVGRLASLLTQTAGGTPPTPREIAELLWFAQILTDHQAPGADAADCDTPHGDTADPHQAPEPVPAPDTVPAPDPTPAPGTPARPAAPPAADRVPLHLPAAPPPSAADSAPAPSAATPATGTAAAPGTPLLAPVPPMLPRPLALQRALRPLKRTVPSAWERRLDERATADRIARSGAHPEWWLPELRPARERWLRLHLVHDTGPTMPVWRPLVRELHAALAQSGVFRTVTPHPAGPDGRVRHVPRAADGRSVVLVVSDCSGPQWHPGPAGERWYRTLRHWAARMPLAVVQPLPERLWAATALPAEPGVFASPAAGAASTALTFTPREPGGPDDHLGSGDPRAPAGPDSADRPYPHPAAVPVPVLEADAPWLAHWAALVAGPGGARVPGAAAWLPPVPPERGAAADPADLTARDLVLRFRATASPAAFRLAGHLALTVPSVPVMRLVQRAVERDPRPQHLAEVILSGLLTTAPGPPGSYDFRPGVAGLLLRTLPRTARERSRELLARTGGLIDRRAGAAAGEFRALTTTGTARPTAPDTPAAPGAHPAPDGEPPYPGPAFATVRPDTVRRLGGADGPAAPATAPVAAPTLRFSSFPDLDGRPEARILLEYAVHEVLERGGLTPQQYEVLVRPDGYRVRLAPDVFLLAVLAAVLRWTPARLSGRGGSIPLRVTFTSGGGEAEPPAPARSARVQVIVPPDLYEAFADSSAAAGPHRFHPLYGDTPDGPPLAWHCPLHPPTGHRPTGPDGTGGAGGSDSGGDGERDLVQGPFITRDLGALGVPAPGRTAVVHLRADGPAALLDPARPPAGPRARPTTYYEVDLTPRRDVRPMLLPSAGREGFRAVADLSWRVDDPVAFVRAEVTDVAERLHAHLLRTASAHTRRYPSRRVVTAERALDGCWGRWPVPGLTVTCAVRLTPEWAPERRPGARPDGAAGADPVLLGDAAAVLLGFDGPVARLFTAAAARRAALDLLALADGNRDAREAPTGRAPAAPAARATLTHPLDVLRIYAHDRVAPLLRDRLAALELTAAPDAPTTHHAVALIRELAGAGRRVAVVTDVSETAVRRHVAPYRLPLDAVHGRGPDLTRLTPDPAGPLGALDALGVAAADAVLVGATVAELTAAQRAGLRFVGLARNPTVEQELRAAGCAVTVRSLAPLLEEVRARRT
ncbi:SAV_2336 N-terminal domain-related protein [Streptomyces sp. NPDC091281]|uniref:SAV_2336 N-terminal domain-related protein n=1 Tax=Streptomyces sp. NPDC091281 TaxID=3365985 RepID=UPI00381585D4